MRGFRSLPATRRFTIPYMANQAANSTTNYVSGQLSNRFKVNKVTIRFDDKSFDQLAIRIILSNAAPTTGGDPAGISIFSPHDRQDSFTGHNMITEFEHDLEVVDVPKFLTVRAVNSSLSQALRVWVLVEIEEFL